MLCLSSWTPLFQVHLVDTETRELVYALIITAEAQGPLVTRCDTCGGECGIRCCINHEEGKSSPDKEGGH